MAAGEVIGTWLVFFVVCIAASRLGLLAPKLGLPLITGYLFVGAICGPFVLGIQSSSDVTRLSYVSQFALAFISFSAGAELYLPELRALFKSILWQTTMSATVMLLLVTPLVFALAASGMVPFMASMSSGCAWSIAGTLSTIMVTLSPASAIAVSKELRAKGVFTSTMLGITVLCDVYVMPFFTLATTVAESECKGEGFSTAALGVMVATLIADVAIGYVLGKFLIFLMWFKRFPARYLILPLGLAIFVVCHWFTDFSREEVGVVINLEPILICIAAGYVCTNQSKHRHRFMNVLEGAGPLVFLPFFTVTGASLDLRVLLQSFAFAAIVAVVRAACLFAGSASGGAIAGQTKQHNMLMWLTMVTQAGVSLGLASEVAMAFPGFGRAFQTAIISIVLINQIVGPILFKIAVRRAGDAGKAAVDDAFDVDAQIPTALVVGGGADGVTTALRLLHENWQVVMIAANPREAAEATAAVRAYAEAKRAADKKARSAVAAVVAAVKKPLVEVKDTLQALQDKAAGAGSLKSASSSAPSDAFVATTAAGAAATLRAPLSSPSLRSRPAPPVLLPAIPEAGMTPRIVSPTAGDPGTGASATRPDTPDSDQDTSSAAAASHGAAAEAISQAAGANAGAVQLGGTLRDDDAHGVASTGESGSPVHAEASDGAAHDEHDEEEHHGPRRPNMEDMFSAVALLGDDVPAHDNPFQEGAPLDLVLDEAAIRSVQSSHRVGRAASFLGDVAAAAMASGGAAAHPDRVDMEAGAARARAESLRHARSMRASASFRRTRAASVGEAAALAADVMYAELVAQVERIRTLQAIAVVLPSDVGCYIACQVLEAAIAAAPKKSHLHSVRLLAQMHDPEWADVYTQLGIIPLHSACSSAWLSAKLLTAPVSRPVALARAFPNNDELARDVAMRSIGGDFFWRLTEGIPMPPEPTIPSNTAAALVLKSMRASGGAKEWMQELMARPSFAALRTPLSKLQSNMSIAAEEVPAWQRQTYVDSIDRLNEGVMAGNIERSIRASAAMAASRTDRMSMYGSVIQERERGTTQQDDADSQGATAPPADMFASGEALAARLMQRLQTRDSAATAAMGV